MMEGAGVWKMHGCKVGGSVKGLVDYDVGGEVGVGLSGK
jgi:hypothetical protein